MATIAANAGLLEGLLTELGKSPTLSNRTEIWRAALPVILERPFLGHSIISHWQRPMAQQTGFWPAHAHNGYLQMLIDLGAVGLAMLLLQMISMFVCALRWLRLQGGRQAVWPVCMCSYLLLYNLSEVLLMKENSFVWVLYVAASFAVRDSVSRKAAPRR
jgi:O-antigen ligase